MWHNLVASRTTGEQRDSAVEARDRVAGLMIPTQIAEAQRLAREWDTAHPRGPRDPFLLELEKIRDVLGGGRELQIVQRGTPRASRSSSSLFSRR